MLCFGLALFFLLLGAGVVDLWGAMTAQQNLQAIAQDAANAGASGVNTDVYRSDERRHPPHGNRPSAVPERQPVRGVHVGDGQPRGPG